MDPLMSPFSMGTTTPLHHPDEDLTNFHQQNQTNVYHNLMNPPRQMAHTYPPSLTMSQPATPVSIFIRHHYDLLTAFLTSAKSFCTDGSSISFNSRSSESTHATQQSNRCQSAYVKGTDDTHDRNTE